MSDSNKSLTVKEAALQELFSDVLELLDKLESVDKSLIQSTDLVVSKTNEALGAFIVKIDNLKTLLESPSNQAISLNRKIILLALFFGVSIGLSFGVILSVFLI